MQRHPLDPVSLVAGLFFAGLSIWLMTGRVVTGHRHLTLVWAAGAVILGLGLLASGRRSHRQAIESAFQPEPAGQPEQTGTGRETAGGIGED